MSSSLSWSSSHTISHPSGPTGGVAGGPPWTWGGGLARSWAQTVTRASGGGELCLVVVAQQSAEGFGVQHVEVLETGGEPALAEWFGRRVIGGVVLGVELLYNVNVPGEPAECYNKNVYLIADVSSGSDLGVWFGR